MKLQTQIPLQKVTNQIDYASQLLLVGSCFSENIGSKLHYFKFQTLQNPFGILFHPLAIENLITRAINKKHYTKEELFFLNERWHCFDAHSVLSDVSKEQLLKTLNTQLVKTEAYLRQATHIIMTLGTAWVYRKKESGKAVANCHKVPQGEFDKHLMLVTEITSSLMRTISQVKTINKNAQLVFTVSPVRHLKDGFIENQRSKSNLITALHEALGNHPLRSGVLYFPAYELMMDELRDYRFYDLDMVHPNQLAIDYIWEKFVEVWISVKAEGTLKKVGEIQKGLQHKPFNAKSLEHQKFQMSLQEKITHLQMLYPFMQFGS